MPETPAKERQQSRRQRELALGRRGRLLFLTDEEFIKIKEIIAFVRDVKEGDTVKIEMRKTR